MNYIKRTNQGIEIQEHTRQLVERGLLDYLNTLCLQDGSTYLGRIHFSQSIAQTKDKPVLYINDDVILVPTMSIRRYEVVLFNLFNVHEYRIKETCIELVFKNQSKICLNISKKYLKIKS